MRFSSDDPLIEDGIFEPGAPQACHRLVHITGIVKDGDNRSHQALQGGDGDKAGSSGKIFRLSFTRVHPGKMHRREERAGQSRLGAKLTVP
jgi:hypothetical protein